MHVVSVICLAISVSDHLVLHRVQSVLTHESSASDTERRVKVCFNGSATGFWPDSGHAVKALRSKAIDSDVAVPINPL